MTATEKMVLDRLEALDNKFDDKLDKILIQTTKTNGRVDNLEEWKKAVQKLVYWALGLIVAVLGFFIKDWMTKH
jgi:hypothetical protein